MKQLLAFKVIVLLVFVLASPLMAQEWKAIVIKASSSTDDGSGNLIITLASGATIQISRVDWSSMWSEAINKAITNQEMEKAEQSGAEPPSDAAAAAMIRPHCANQWPDDFTMRKYCEDQQYEGLRSLRGRQMTGGLAKIRSKCAGDWPDDLMMRDYCEKQQLEALRELNR